MRQYLRLGERRYLHQGLVLVCLERTQCGLGQRGLREQHGLQLLERQCLSRDYGKRGGRHHAWRCQKDVGPWPQVLWNDKRRGARRSWMSPMGPGPRLRSQGQARGMGWPQGQLDPLYLWLFRLDEPGGTRSARTGASRNHLCDAGSRHHETETGTGAGSGDAEGGRLLAGEVRVECGEAPGRPLLAPVAGGGAAGGTVEELTSSCGEGEAETSELVVAETARATVSRAVACSACACRALGLPQCALYQNRAVAQARNVLVQQESAVRRSSRKHARLRCRGVPEEQRTPPVLSPIAAPRCTVVAGCGAGTGAGRGVALCWAARGDWDRRCDRSRNGNNAAATTTKDLDLSEGPVSFSGKEAINAVVGGPLPALR
ncbi:hypothetical protein MRX96_050678 [Rhipicephalus microplus]